MNIFGVFPFEMRFLQREPMTDQSEHKFNESDIFIKFRELWLVSYFFDNNQSTNKIKYSEKRYCKL